MSCRGKLAVQQGSDQNGAQVVAPRMRLLSRCNRSHSGLIMTSSSLKSRRCAQCSLPDLLRALPEVVHAAHPYLLEAGLLDGTVQELERGVRLKELQVRTCNESWVHRVLAEGGLREGLLTDMCSPSTPAHQASPGSYVAVCAPAGCLRVRQAAAGQGQGPGLAVPCS